MRALAAVLGAALALPAAAQDADPHAFEAGSEAKPWNLYAEIPARFEARVVDLLCEVAGECAPECGGGDRQLGLVRAADGVLVFPNKNAQPLFTGAAAELLPYCGRDVEVDGLLLDDPDLGAVNVYLVQRIRGLDEPEWTAADRWTTVWAEETPEADGPGPWFRRDPRVAAHVAADGWFGLGLEEDAAILRELYAE